MAKVPPSPPTAPVEPSRAGPPRRASPDAAPGGRAARGEVRLARGAPPEAFQTLFRDLDLGPELGRALFAQLARALEAAARSPKRKSSALGKARALATHAPAAAQPVARLVPLLLEVRDLLKAGVGTARSARARADRIDRAADAALRALAARARTAQASDGGGAGDPVAEPQSAGGDRGASEELLERLVTVTPDAVLTVRASGRVGLWSVAASRLTGRRRWEIHRRGLGALFAEKGTYEALRRELEERGRVIGREVVLRNTAGEDVPVRIFGARLKTEPPAAEPEPGGGRRAGARRGQGEVDRYVLLLHDLTEVHRIRRRLIETEKLSAMAKIAGSVAHEFRNPLNSLFLATDLLEDELEGREAVRESIAPTLAAIREEIERLNQIITHYLALSKISSTSPEVMDLGDVVRNFAEETGPRCVDQAVDLRVRADDGDHHITADPNQVRRILVNLVENALDAVREAGEQEDGRGRRPTVTLLLRRMRRSVKLTVKDNGPGIPEEVRERVFEPFFTSKAGGSGLGLYLVREIALGSGGTMTLSSAVGRGTSVSIRWPFVERDADSA